MELRVLRSFVVLAEDLHFGRAAGRLGIVQPALSMQIKTLEQELGVRLFIRDRHHVELSPAGLLFLPGARATLDQAQRAVRLAQAGERGEIGRLRIGFVSSVLPWYLPTLIRGLRASFPGIDLDLKDMPTPDQLRRLKENQIDFGFVRLPIDAQGIDHVEVLREGFVVALPAGHRLASRDVLVPTDLGDAPCFLLARRFAPGFTDDLMLALSRDGLIPEIAGELGEFTTMLALVGAGMGLGILPELSLPGPTPGVVVRPLSLSGGHLSRVGLVWNDLSPAINRTFHREATRVGPVSGEPPVVAG